MTSLVANIAIVVWLIAFAIAMIVKRSPEALCTGMLAGWLFLPQFIYDLPGVTLNKLKLITLVTGILVILVKRSNGPAFRFSLLDLPVLGLSVAALGASVSNGLGAYDGSVVALELFIVWGIPWFIGRSVFSSAEKSMLLCRATILAGLAYIPFCLFEMKMAPRLHLMIFGYPPRIGTNFRAETMRFGMWRPQVFMEMGLQLSIFLGIASILALWMAMSERRRIAGISARVAAVLLGVTTVLCVSSGAIILTGLGWTLVLCCRTSWQRWFLLLLATIPVAYPIIRMTNIGAVVVEVSAENDELAARQASLRTRVTQEDRLMTVWKKKILLGSTSRYFLDVGDGEKSLVDSLWVQTLCKFGLVGWGCLTAVLIIPVIVMCFRLNAAQSPQRAEHALGIGILIFMFDCQFNAMENPVPVVMAGAIVGVVAQCNGRHDRIISSDETGLKRSIRRSRRLWPPQIEIQQEL